MMIYAFSVQFNSTTILAQYSAKILNFLFFLEVGKFVFDDINLLSVQDPVRLAAHRVNPYALTFSQNTWGNNGFSSSRG